MPLTDEEWKEADKRHSWAEVFQKFLEREYPMAYSADELVNKYYNASKINIGGEDVVDAVFLTFVQSILEDLIAEGKVESRVPAYSNVNEAYYRAVKET